MSLGYALLHRNRIEVALEAQPVKQTIDDLGDFVFSGLGAGDLGSGLNDFLNTRSRLFDEFVQNAQRLAEDDGPLERNTLGQCRLAR